MSKYHLLEGRRVTEVELRETSCFLIDDKSGVKFRKTSSDSGYIALNKD